MNLNNDLNVQLFGPAYPDYLNDESKSKNSDDTVRRSATQS